MKIGELSQITATPVDTIRYYEKIGLLPAPARSAANYRHYGEAHAQRLAFVRRCRALDMSLAEIRSLLGFCDSPESDCGEINTLLDERIAQVEARIAEITALAADLRSLRSACRSPGRVAQCRIIKKLGGAPA
ncbi:MAG: Cd(II)/Pb(II)-responsive transcriptional regulator [Burkholderiaceae bacterium]